MALGFLGKLFGMKSNSPQSSPSAEKVDPTVAKNDLNAAENGGQRSRRPMNRIDGPITRPISGEGALASDDDADVAIGKQMELEAGNAIQYRTCSWQKVRSSYPP